MFFDVDSDGQKCVYEMSGSHGVMEFLDVDLLISLHLGLFCRNFRNLKRWLAR